MRGDVDALCRISAVTARQNLASEVMRRGIAKRDAKRAGRAPPARLDVARAAAGRTPQRLPLGLAVPKPGALYGVARDFLGAYTVPAQREGQTVQKRAFHVCETERALLLAPRRAEAVLPDVLFAALERAYGAKCAHQAAPVSAAGGAPVKLFSAAEALPFPLFNALEGSAHAVHAVRINLGQETTVFALFGADAHAEAVAPDRLGLDARAFAQMQNRAAQMLAVAIGDE